MPDEGESMIPISTSIDVEELKGKKKKEVGRAKKGKSEDVLKTFKVKKDKKDDGVLDEKMAKIASEMMNPKKRKRRGDTFQGVRGDDDLNERKDKRKKRRK
jgi:hypothetical protein